MPRSNHPRRRGRQEEGAELDLDRVLLGRLRVEVKRDGEWNVQPHTAGSALKAYTCPGCGLEIAPGTAHLVAWRADGIMGAADDLAGRRHWHTRCWRIRT
ncbi:MAG: hypothetical protein KF727_00830 [Microbacteriaceae bacterium]|nr:hypothetical protein [Microbacteriaceae bacterium]